MVHSKLSEVGVADVCQGGSCSMVGGLRAAQGTPLSWWVMWGEWVEWMYLGWHVVRGPLQCWIEMGWCSSLCLANEAWEVKKMRGLAGQEASEQENMSTS